MQQSSSRYLNAMENSPHRIRYCAEHFRNIIIKCTLGKNFKMFILDFKNLHVKKQNAVKIQV